MIPYTAAERAAFAARFTPEQRLQYRRDKVVGKYSNSEKAVFASRYTPEERQKFCQEHHKNSVGQWVKNTPTSTTTRKPLFLEELDRVEKLFPEIFPPQKITIPNQQLPSTVPSFPTKSP